MLLFYFLHTVSQHSQNNVLIYLTISFKKHIILIHVYKKKTNKWTLFYLVLSRHFASKRYEEKFDSINKKIAKRLDHILYKKYE